MSDDELPDHPNRGTQYSPGKGKKVNSWFLSPQSSENLNSPFLQYRDICCETTGSHMWMNLCVDSYDDLVRTLGAQLGEGLWNVPDCSLIFVRDKFNGGLSIQQLGPGTLSVLDDHLYYGLQRDEVEGLVKDRIKAVAKSAERNHEKLEQERQRQQELEKELEHESEPEIELKRKVTRKRGRGKKEEKEDFINLDDPVQESDPGEIVKKARKTDRELWQAEVIAQQKREITESRNERVRWERKASALEKTLASKEKEIAKERESSAAKQLRVREDKDDEQKKFEDAKKEIKSRFPHMPEETVNVWAVRVARGRSINDVTMETRPGKPADTTGQLLQLFLAKMLSESNTPAPAPTPAPTPALPYQWPFFPHAFPQPFSPAPQHAFPQPFSPAPQHAFPQPFSPAPQHAFPQPFSPQQLFTSPQAFFQAPSPARPHARSQRWVSPAEKRPDNDAEDEDDAEDNE